MMLVTKYNCFFLLLSISLFFSSFILVEVNAFKYDFKYLQIIVSDQPKTAVSGMINKINWKANRAFKVLANLNASVTIFDAILKTKCINFTEKVKPTVDAITKLVKDIVTASPTFKKKWLSSLEAVNALEEPCFCLLGLKSPAKSDCYSDTIVEVQKN